MTTNPESTIETERQLDAIVMSLSPAEAAIVDSYRAELEAKRLAAELQRITLLLVSGWAEWNEQHGYGLTYTTFLDDFDCDQYIPIDLQKYRKQIYEMVGDAASSVHHRCREIVGA